MGAGLLFMALFGISTNVYDNNFWTPEPPIIHTLSNGDLLEEKPGEMCPAASDEPTASCTQVAAVPGEPEGSKKRKYTIYYPAGADGHHVRLHEVGHALGGKHAEWQPHGSGRSCAQVTEAGRSGWKVGEWECTQYAWPDTAPMSPHEKDVRQAKTGVAELH